MHFILSFPLLLDGFKIYRGYRAKGAINKNKNGTTLKSKSLFLVIIKNIQFTINQPFNPTLPGDNKDFMGRRIIQELPTFF